MRTENVIIDNGANLEKTFCQAFETIVNKIDDIQEDGSGWSLEKILQLDVYNDKYVCFNASQYIPLPSYITAKKAIINIDNTDEKRLKWAFQHIHKLKNHRERSLSYAPFSNEYILHYRTLKMVLRNGLKLTGVGLDRHNG